jgi:hypothetical protein
VQYIEKAVQEQSCLYWSSTEQKKALSILLRLACAALSAAARLGCITTKTAKNKIFKNPISF